MRPGIFAPIHHFTTNPHLIKLDFAARLGVWVGFAAYYGFSPSVGLASIGVAFGTGAVVSLIVRASWVRCLVQGVFCVVLAIQFLARTIA